MSYELFQNQDILARVTNTHTTSKHVSCIVKCERVMGCTYYGGLQDNQFTRKYIYLFSSAIFHQIPFN